MSSSVCTLSCDMAQTHGPPKQEAFRVLHQSEESFLFSSLKGDPADLQPLQHEQLKFLIGLHQQLEGLETRLLQEMGEEKSLLGDDDSSLAVERSFQRTSLYVRKKEYSSVPGTLSYWKSRSENQYVLSLGHQVTENLGQET
nr:PREDICTED: interferon alpha-17-like [Equus przewalskii]XP_023482956.1 interferon omega-1-like [Equus caballus]